MSPTQRPDTLMQDRPPPARRNPLATHGRTIHPGQSRRSRHVRDMSALPPTAVDLVRCSETTRCAMCGRIWTPPDCNGVRHVEDQGPQLLTYIRLPDAAYVGAASLDGFSPASTSMAPRHWPKPCRSTHQVREATGSPLSPSLPIVAMAWWDLLGCPAETFR